MVSLLFLFYSALKCTLEQEALGMWAPFAAGSHVPNTASVPTVLGAHLEAVALAVFQMW